jgi:peptidoglycan/xylan/chitin deacetylase (PgdA/CDA1 family)
MKHRLKMFLRELIARLVYHTPLWRLCDLLAPRRLLILAGHCVEAPSNAFLPPDMKIREETLEGVLVWLNRRFKATRVAEGWAALQGGSGESLFALSMDDGYRDNLTHLLPLTERLGVPVTIYLESRPLEGEKVNWTHKFFWLLERMEVTQVGHRYGELTTIEQDDILTNQIVAAGIDVIYLWKKMLKYEVDQGERDRVIDLIFAEAGGDEAALCAELYLDKVGAVALKEAGWELGGHTRSHEAVSALDEAAQRHEIVGGREALIADLGVGCESFAYPFGRRWDFDETSVSLAREAGFECAVTTHAGANTRSSDAYRLGRSMIEDSVQLHLVAAEMCGAFILLRKLGLDLSE